MNLREATIGRSRNCDIYLDQRCQYASSQHGTIYYDGSQLMYRDTSSNGTLINNISVRKRAVPIRRGDVIMIAGKYPISWNQIDSFFPSTQRAHQQSNINYVSQPTNNYQSSAAIPSVPTAPQKPSRWSWGAFVLSWLWGFFNGCWWMFLVKFCIYLMMLLFFWVPFLGFFFIIADIGTSVLFGIKGTEWAWNNKQWSSVADFEQTQNTWNKVGMILFFIGIGLTVLTLIFSMAAIASLF